MSIRLHHCLLNNFPMCLGKKIQKSDQCPMRRLIIIPPPSADLLPHIGPFGSFSLARECPLQHCTSASSVLPTSHPPTLGQPTGFSFPDISVLNFSWSPYDSLSYNHIFFLQNSYYNLQASIMLYFYFLNVCFLHYTVSSTKAKSHNCFVLFYLSLSILAPST